MVGAKRTFADSGENDFNKQISSCTKPCLKSHAHCVDAARCIRNVNGRAMSGGNLANECQTNAASLPLGREEGHEYPFALIRRNAWTVVRDHDGHATVRITMGGQRD